MENFKPTGRAHTPPQHVIVTQTRRPRKGLSAGEKMYIFPDTSCRTCGVTGITLDARYREVEA